MDREPEPWRNLNRSFYRNNVGRLASVIVLLTAESALQIYSAVVIQIFVEAGVQRSAEILRTGLVTGGLFLLGVIVLGLSRIYLQAAFLRTGLTQYKQNAFGRLLRRSLREFFSSPSGNYLSAFTNDLDPISENYLSGLFAIIIYTILLVGSIGLMFSYHVHLTIAAILFSLIPLIVGLKIGGRLVPAEANLSDRNRAFVSQIKDLLNGFSIIKSFQVETEAAERFSEENQDLENARFSRKTTQGTIQVIAASLGGAAQFAVFAYGAYLSIQGEISVSVVIAFVQLMNSVVAPIQQLPDLIAQRRAAKKLIDRMEELTSAGEPPADLIPITKIESGIRLQNVNFAHENGPQILTNISCGFRKNGVYAIVGPSGSGKSTLIKLLLGTYPNYQGEIRYDNTELRDLSIDALYDLISLIDQQVFVFDRTIRENISLFKTFPESELDLAVTRSGLDRIIAEKGADAKCGENGKNLSGGERQRISIARALIRKCQALFIDEATSALDNETSRKIMETIFSLQDTTRIVVTHRLEAAELRQFDAILVLKSGQIIESGKFDELIEANGFFYSLYNLSR